MKKLNLTKLVLKTVGEMGIATLDSFFPKKYPQARLWRQLLSLDSDYQFKRQTFSVILTRLQKQGLVERKNNKWGITNFGKKFIKNMKTADVFDLPQKDGILRLVIFDVPERERRRRDWLRLELIACDFKLLQKSVWMGERPLPQEFLENLEEMNLLPHIHIFTVYKRGTIKTDY
ncbi:hypothetical protein A2661_02435 [Candidatus Giovannonibacteria bacterium RIFCSPHIGHO2_01_FULL_45_24]|uniref:Transcriptional repressor PaaX-like central Cas2-like domain-containing protein n=1 Tax=Candidatus Giovannonibacteria bacterium RIFCSPLOWO2_01_FULL_46_32 TaxID=1798353 RepID=A0A1F5XG67_9BACT|nr:MAG: hypothetical protein A2661_02435 [Candidatus Giovannonibacteria bacterium RIFCSPHIGHO2_01_FULL_45_24]OGF86860.1 MAG: hypothetical protein A3B19_02205 [Candidatus Giovannonibacteria bacterium RIFCSPLOWO2_01_FULL_46_32]